MLCISMAATSMAKSFYLEFWLLHFGIVVLKLCTIPACFSYHGVAIVEQDENEIKESTSQFVLNQETKECFKELIKQIIERVRLRKQIVVRQGFLLKYQAIKDLS